MKITGIIAEFNPLHNGHALLFKRAREITGADIIIVILSGAFVQRGAPALFSKYARSEAALACGADLIVELPVFSACASAEYFAEGALRLLFDLGADSFVFGSEAGTLEGLLPLSGLLCEEPQEYRIALKDALATGLSFQAERKKAVLSIMPDAAPLLDEPNNLLGLEYLKVCKKRGYPMAAHTILRQGAGYHEKTLNEIPSAENNQNTSATALRAYWEAGANNTSLPGYFMPKAAFKIFDREYTNRAFVTETALSPLLALRLLQCREADELSVYADMSRSLANRIFSQRYSNIDFPEFAISLKTRELTLTRIKRALLHTVLGITETEQEEFRALPHSPYARILGIGGRARPFLRGAKKDSKSSRPPLILKPARAEKLLTPKAYSFFQKDIACAELYRQLLFQNGASSLFYNEFTHEIIRSE